MLRLNGFQFVVVCWLGLLLTACYEDPLLPKDPELIAEITDIQLDLLDSKPLQLVITVNGNTTSAAWTDPKLQQYTYIAPPADGIYDFSFLAVPPSEPSASVITPIMVTHILSPLGADVKGVRIHAKNNNQTALIPAQGSALFEFKSSDPVDRFVILLRDAVKIQHARDLLSGAATGEPHVLGTIVKQTAPYNSAWRYHLAPDSIQFFDFAAEVCDGNMRYIEEHLDEVGGSLLPGNTWCPWGSELTREIN